MKLMTSFFLLLTMFGCVVVPTKDQSHNNKCFISSDKKTLKVVNLNGEGSGNYYSISGVILSPITMVTTGIVSGIYVLSSNIYHLGEEKLVCN